MKTAFFLITAIFVQAASLAAQEDAKNKPATKRVAFAQSCFWTGEMKLGQIEGVVRTEAGFFKGREVTLVEYAPERIALEALARQAGEKPSVHKDSDQTLVLLAGELRAEIGDAKALLEDGDAVLVPAKPPHRFTNTGKSRATTFSVYARPAFPPNEQSD